MFEVCLIGLVQSHSTLTAFGYFDFRGRMPAEDELLTKEDTVRLKRCLYALQRNDLPPVTTHNVVNDWSDPVLNTIRRCKLFNTTADKVKVSGFIRKMQICVNFLFKKTFFILRVDCIVLISYCEIIHWSINIYNNLKITTQFYGVLIFIKVYKLKQ